jgi:copper(I)-binding protein
MKRPVRTTIAVLALFALGALGLTACGGSEDESTTGTDANTAATAAPTASDAWARASAMSQDMGAMYMTIAGGAEDDALVTVTVPTDIAGRTELHETVMVDGGESTMEMGESTMEMDGMDHGGGEMTMRQVPEIPVPAGGTVMLEPGGLHVMLMDLPGQLEAGTTFEATLTYASGAEQTIEVEVRES